LSKPDINLYFTSNLNKQDYEEIDADVNYNIAKYAGNIENEAAFRKICKRNAERTFHRKKKKYVTACLNYMKEPAPPNDTAEYAEQILTLDAAIEGLSYMKKWVLQQYFKTGNLAEIARQHGLNENSVKSHYNLALGQLRRIMLKKEETWKQSQQS
jgi:DNA-directed RNA polymerase specialized sigma24 family protein